MILRVADTDHQFFHLPSSFFLHSFLEVLSHPLTSLQAYMRQNVIVWFLLYLIQFFHSPSSSMSLLPLILDLLALILAVKL